MPIPLLRAYQRMAPRLRAEAMLDALNVSIWGAHWHRLKSHERSRIINELTRTARSGRSTSVTGGATMLHGPDEIMAFLRKEGAT